MPTPKNVKILVFVKSRVYEETRERWRCSLTRNERRNIAGFVFIHHVTGTNSVAILRLRPYSLKCKKSKKHCPSVVRII